MCVIDKCSLWLLWHPRLDLDRDLERLKEASRTVALQNWSKSGFQGPLSLLSV